MADFRDLNTFMSRMKKLGIEIELSGNVPWIYIDKINKKRVLEKFAANHGFTIGFYPSKIGGKFEMLDIGETFKLIRKYVTK